MPDKKKTTAKTTAKKSESTTAPKHGDANNIVPPNNGPVAQKIAKKRAKLLKKQNRKPHKAGFWFCWIIVALVLGFLGGKFLFGIMPLGTMSGRTVLTEGQLDSIVATYSNNGHVVSVTAREVLEHTVGLESAKDGNNYSYPDASSTLEYVQNTVLNDVVKEKGIEVSDDDMNTYAQNTLGSSDYDSLAAQYGMSIENTKQIIRDSAGVKKLYEQVTGQDAANAVSAPEECADSEKDLPNEKYGQYLANLLGDEWDSTSERWASTSGTYYSELKDEKFTSKSATYNQAKKAYDIAAKNQSSDTTDAAKKWTEYVNDIMANVSIAIGEIL